MSTAVFPQKTDLMTIDEALDYLQNALVLSAGEFALPQSEEILCTVTGLSRSNLYLMSKMQITDKSFELISEIIRRRHNHEPLPYILGSAYFYNREFFVSSSVLIPRPDTETLIEAVLKRESATRKLFLDIGTGSGIIACILSEQKPWKGIAVDVSIDALKVARKNRKSEIALVASDLFCALKPAHQFDFIVSNPPYIADSTIEELDSSVKDFEPRAALRGGADGLCFYRQFANHAADYIRNGGYIYCEIGFDQEESCKKIFETSGWSNVTVICDLGHNPRVISAKAPDV